jgi:predicted AAA+ superfamily ATPase
MERKFMETLLQWKKKAKPKPLMVIGARQTGKTYTITEFCQKEYKDCLYINLAERADIVDVFNEKLPLEATMKKIQIIMEFVFDPVHMILFLDEIQESEEAISAMKYFCESPKPYKVISAGSLLGVKLNRFHCSFPVGKIILETMYPMDFEEFLWACHKRMWSEAVRESWTKNEALAVHGQLLRLYRDYLITGGMPEAVMNYAQSDMDVLRRDKKILSTIITAYLADMNRYTKSRQESVKIEKVYRSIPSILGRELKRFQYSAVEKGANKRDYESAIEWLTASNLAYRCDLVKKVEIPFKAYAEESKFKLYLSDVGLLSSVLEIQPTDILLDKPFIYKGVIAENYVAQALRTKGIPLYYWQSENKAEIDFLLYNEDGLIPLEVKAGEHTRSKSLGVFMKRFRSPYGIRVSAGNFGFENGIKAVPLYAAFCL